jgi:peptide chain release factor subunit 1
VLAGSAEFKNDLHTSELFDGRLLKVVIKLVDVSYGGENGFNQAIELSAETLANVKFVQEKKLICKYFDHISQDTGKFCFGVADTYTALEMGAVEILIVWEDLPTLRLELINNQTNEASVIYVDPENEKKDKTLFIDKTTGADLEVKHRDTLIEWLTENYKTFGTTLEFVTNRSGEGSQFCKGFGGIGGILRWQVDFAELQTVDDGKEFNDDSDDDGGFDDDGDWGF